MMVAMCARVDQGFALAWLQAILQAMPNEGFEPESLQGPADWAPKHNLAPTQSMLLLARGREGGFRLGQGRFGWTVPWNPGPLLNARLESVEDKASFRQAWQQRRVVVPVAGYYEWEHLEGKGKAPWRFTHPEVGGLLYLAALWQKAEGGQVEAAILTTAANEEAAPVHDRMPWLLPAEALAAWLGPGPVPPEVLARRGPAPLGHLRRHRVDPNMGKKGAEGPWCSLPYTPPEPAQGRLPGF